MTLCVITDTAVQHSFDHLELAQLAIQGGADMIQLRDKKLSSNELLEIACAVAKLCQSKNIRFIVNDRVDIALLSDADGVHLGEEDLSVWEARKILGSRKIIGATAHHLERAQELEKEGADYIGFGHIFPTSSKEKNTPPQGIAELKKVCLTLKIPIIAIGGIGKTNLNEVLEAGPHGIAVISAVCGEQNPEKATRALKEIIHENTGNLNPCRI